MFLKKFDWISPPITLYFKGEGAHVSIYSGILSIIAYVITFAAAIYYALGFINRESPKAYFFTRYVEDAGTFPVNATQMFHFIQVSDPQTCLVLYCLRSCSSVVDHLSAHQHSVT